MNDATTETFNRLRPRLQGIAYRMLGSSAEAEDIVQDAWLRWHVAAGAPGAVGPRRLSAARAYGAARGNFHALKTMLTDDAQLY